MIINNLDPDIDELIQQNEISVEKFGKIHISTDVFYPASATYKLISDQYIKNKQYINNQCIENKQFVIDTYANVQLDLDNKADIVHYHNLSDIYGFETNSTQINSQSNSFKYKKCNVDGSNERFSFGFTINRFVPFFNTLPSLFNVNNSNDTTAYVKLWVGGNGVHSTMGDTINTSGGSPGGDINVCFQDAFYIVARTAYKGAYMVVPFEITEDIDAENSFIKLRLYANAGSATNDMCFGWSMFAISKDDIRNIYTGSGIALTQDMVTTIIDPEYVKYSSYITRKIDRHIPANSYVFLCFTANPYFIDDSSKDIKKIYNQYITTNGYDNDKIIQKVFENTGYRWFNGGTFLYFHDVSLCIKTIVDKDDLTGDDKTNLTLQDVITDLNSRLAFLESKNRMEIDSALQSLNTRVDQLDTNVNYIEQAISPASYLTQKPDGSSETQSTFKCIVFNSRVFGLRNQDIIKSITIKPTIAIDAGTKMGLTYLKNSTIKSLPITQGITANTNGTPLTFDFSPAVSLTDNSQSCIISFYNSSDTQFGITMRHWSLNPLSNDIYVTATDNTKIYYMLPLLSVDYYHRLDQIVFADDLQSINTSLTQANNSIEEINNSIEEINLSIGNANDSIEGFNDSIEEINNQTSLFNQTMTQTVSTSCMTGTQSFANIDAIVFKPSAFKMLSNDKLKSIILSVDSSSGIDNTNVKLQIMKFTSSGFNAVSKPVEYIPRTQLVFDFLELKEYESDTQFIISCINADTNVAKTMRIAAWNKNDMYVVNNDLFVTYNNFVNLNVTPCMSVVYYPEIVHMNDVQSTIEENNNKPTSSGAVYNALTAITETPEKRSSYWSDVVEALENCSPSDFNMTNLTYNGDNESLTQLGTTDNHVMYKFDANDDQSAKNIDWNILGYNATVPEYIKYKDASGNKVFVKSTKNGLLSSIVANDPVYINAYNDEQMKSVYQEIGQISSIGSDTFEYGNNVKYSVPMSIIVNETTYTFCGYNMTLQSQYLINDSTAIDGQYMSIPWCLNDFSDSNLSNVWSNSNVRKWLNDKDYSCSAISYNITTQKILNEFASKSFISRMTNDYDFMKNVQNVVNKTHVNNSFVNNLTHDENNCEHTIDKFWLFDNGQLNATNNDLSDQLYTTSILSNSFPGFSSRVKYVKDALENTYSNGVYYYTRSSSSTNNQLVGFILNDGDIFTTKVAIERYEYNGIIFCYGYGIAPACTIG